MALVKYSIGGPITSVVERRSNEDSVEKREEAPLETAATDEASYIIVCGKCKIQHMILAAELSRACSCGNTVKLGDLS